MQQAVASCLTWRGQPLCSGSPPGTSMHGQPLHTAGDNINQRKTAAPSAPVPDVTHGVELVHWDSQRQRCPEAWSCPRAVWVLLAGVELAQDLQSCVSQRCWAQGELHLDCRYLTPSRLLCLLSLSCPEKCNAMQCNALLKERITKMSSFKRHNEPAKPSTQGMGTGRQIWTNRKDKNPILFWLGDT